MKITVTLPYVRIAAEIPESDARCIAQYVLAAAGKAGGPTEATASDTSFDKMRADEEETDEAESGGGSGDGACYRKRGETGAA